MKELPKIYKQSIDKKIANNDTVYYCTSNDSSTYDPLSLIDSLFKEGGHIFNKALLIKTKDKTYDTDIIQKKNDSIYTLSDDVIKICDIVSIERK